MRIELLLEPAQAGRAEQSSAFAGNDRVEPDEADAVERSDVMQELAAGIQVFMRGERRLQRSSIVVVAGNQVDRHGKRCEQRNEMPVLLVATGVGEISRYDHYIG